MVDFCLQETGLKIYLHSQTAKTDTLDDEIRVWYRSVDCFRHVKSQIQVI